MVTYQYRCDEHGPTDVNRPMGTAPARSPCPVCTEPARRVFATPMIARGDHNARRLIESTEATSDRPDVVTAVPPTSRRLPRHPTALANPLLRKLPRL